MDQFNGKPVPQLTRDFIRTRNESWSENNQLWAKYVTGDAFRLRSFQAIGDLLAREQALCQSGTMRIADFGCGEGSLLALISAGFHGVELIGIDNCSSLLARVADSQNISRIDQDIESTNFHLRMEIDVAIAAFSLIEMTALDQCMRNVAAPVRTGGAAIVVVLDPTVELLRMIRFKYGEPGVALYDVEDELVLASHFVFDKISSPRPYFRFLRPIDRYIASGSKAGLALERIETVGAISLTQMSNEPRAIILVMRKASQATRPAI
jgi:SAM-dependent methyltransferase